MSKAKKGTQKRNLNHRKILNNIIELASDKLNDWESGFCESITEYFNRHPDTELTKKQEICLLKIQDKYLKYK